MENGRFWYIVAFLFFASVLMLFIQIDPLDRTFGGLTLFFVGFVPGAALGLLIVWGLHCFEPPFMWSGELPVLYITVGFTIGFFTAAGASKINRHWAEPKVQIVTHPVLRKYVRHGKGRAPYLTFFFEREGTRGSVKVRPAFWKALEVGDSVRFTMRRGFFGFQFIDKVERADAPPQQVLP